MALFTKILEAILKVFGIVSKRQEVKAVYVEEHRPAEAAKGRVKAARKNKRADKIENKIVLKSNKRNEKAAE